MAESTVESSAEVAGVIEEVPIRVLHVDDESGFLKAAKQILEMQGAFQVETALSVKEAMEKMNEKTYDVIVSDYVMPEIGGLEFLKELRQKRNMIPFIIFTGKGREEVVIKALNLGADHYINKIGHPETVYYELAHGIRQAVERKRADMEIWRREERLRAILASSPDIITVSDLQGSIIDCNEAAWKLTGFSSKKGLLGKSSFEFIAEKDRKRALENLKKTLEQGTTRNIEYTLLKKDGEEYMGELSASILKDSSGNPIGFVGVVRDVTERKKAERAVRTNREKFERLFINNPEATVYVNSDFHILDANPRFSQLFGYSSDEIKGKSLFDLIVPKDLDQEGEMLDREAKKAYTYYDTVRKRKDGTLLPVSISAAPITVEDQTIGYVGLYKDITERKRFEERLSALNTYSLNLNMAESMKEIYQVTLDAMEKTLGFENAAFMVVDEGMLCVVDQRGYPEILSLKLPLDGTEKGITIKAAKTGRSILVPDTKKERDYVEGMPDMRSELDVPVKIGRKVLGILSVESEKLNAFDEKDQKLLEILASHAAIAMSNLGHAKDLKAYAQEVQESQKKFEGLFMGNPEAAVYLDSDFRILDFNLRFEELFGYSLDEVKGKHINSVIVPKNRMGEAEALDKRASKGETYQEDTVRKRKDGSLVAVSISAAPITVEDKPIGHVGLYRDITERKRFEERLSALNTYSQKLNTAESMKEIYRLALDAMEKTLGFEHAFFMAVDEGMLCVVDQRGYPVDLSIRLPLDGSKKGVSVKVARTGKPINVPDAEKEDAWVEFWPGICSGLDVPVKIGRKVLGVIGVDSKSLNAFDEKDQKLLEILASHAAIAMSNLGHAKDLKAYAQEIRETKEKFERLFMDNPEATVYVDQDSHILDVNPRFEELFGYSLDEVKGKHIDNVVVPRDKMEEGKMLQEKALKGHFYYETVRKRKDGSLVAVSISAAPITVEDKLIGTVGLYKDISQLKKTEKTLRNTLEKLETLNEKLRVVGRLTRHDVRNKLAAVTGNVYLAKKRLPADHENMDQLVEIESAVRQVGEIFDFATIYESLGAEELVYMDVEKDVEGAVALFSDLQGVKVVNDCCGLTVLADSLLRQLFYNLIDNSLKYGEKISKIRVYYEEADEDTLKLVYEDDGVGVPKAEKKKIFKEGYGKGTGYGLYLIKKICEVYNWTIQETGKQGTGARFLITIPEMNESGKTAYRLHSVSGHQSQ